MALIFDSWLADAATVITVIIATIYLYAQNSYSYWKRRNIKYLEPSFPFGNVKDLFFQRKSLGEQFEEIYFKLDGHKYGGIFSLLRPTLILRDPELIKQIMIKSFENFHDHGFYFNEKDDPLTANLFFLSGIRWRNLRAKMSPTFTSGKMKMMFQTLANCGEQLRLYLNNFSSEGDDVEIKDLLSRYSTDIIASCAFGVDTNCLKNPDAEFRVWGRKIFKTTIKTGLRDALIVAVPSLAAILKIPFVPKDVTKYFTAVVKETVQQRESNNISRNDFMQLLIQLKNKGFVDPDKLVNVQNEKEEVSGENNKLTLLEIAAQAFVFYVAGFETSSTTMTFCLYELANNINIQKNLRNEIRNVLKKYDGIITYEAIHEMEYLDKVISETLRLHPPVPFLNRVCDKDFIIEDTGDVVEKGTPVLMPIRGMQRDPKYFPNPDLFNPENFSEDAVRRRPNFTYMPFGEGPRICIGQRFGLMQVKVGLVSVLHDNQVTMSPKTQVPLKLDTKSIITSPVGGMWLHVSRVE